MGRGNSSESDEKWLDVRQVGILGPIMSARFDICKAKGFDAIEPDNMMVFDQDSGFSIAYAQNLAYVKYLVGDKGSTRSKVQAQLAHARGMAIAIKNSNGQVADLKNDFDFVISESSFYYQEQAPFVAMIALGKPVSVFCSKAR